MAGVTDYYTIPAALFLGATVQQVGLITALPNLLSSLSQFFSVQVIYWVGGRLKLLVRLVLSQATLILCVAMLPLFPIAHPVGLLLNSQRNPKEWPPHLQLTVTSNGIVRAIESKRIFAELLLLCGLKYQKPSRNKRPTYARRCIMFWCSTCQVQWTPLINIHY